MARGNASHFGVRRTLMQSTRDKLSDDLASVACGDVTAFVRVYQATSRKLYGVVLRILGTRDGAEEVLQEVYMRVWQRAGDFSREQASPITWLVTIARNRALDEKRRKQIGPLEDVPELLEFPSDDDILAEYLQQEELDRLNQSLAKLGADQRRLLELIYFQGMTRDEAAAELGISLASVRSRLRATLTELKSMLSNG
jgi:RNA polymerase sigma-70 factor, ECF subfamily